MFGFDLRSAHVGYAVKTVVLGQISLRVPLVSPGSIIPPVLYNYVFIVHLPQMLNRVKINSHTSSR